jgi:hypothetical protein
MNRRARIAASGLLALALAVAGGCKKDDENTCTLGDAASCEDGLVCEEVQGAEPACFAPIVVRGQVFDPTDADAPVAGADVVALDANGQAVTLTGTTDADGNYELTVPAMRDADGNVVDGTAVTLRVDADDYVAFPKPPRFAIPVDLTVAVDTDGTLVVDSAVTDVALFPIPASATEYGTITGSIAGDDAAGALVVADQGDPAVAVSTAIVGTDGSFTLFNVPVGESTTVTAYAAGVQTDVATVTIAAAGGTEDVVLTADAVGLATVEGNLNPVNAPNFSGDAPTSVLLVVESTFSALTRAGYVPSGLRDGSLTASDTDFSIEGVPPGRYVVLASFENDGVVRDPDLEQGGTSIRHIEVSDAGVVTSLLDPLSGDIESLNGIKITDAIATVAPGAESLEIVATAPTFEWAKDPGTDHYELRIFDAYGALVYEDLAVPQPGGSGPVAYDTVGGNFVVGTGFDEGMIYQFRVVSIGTGGNMLSTTEDLRGVFQFAP